MNEIINENAHFFSADDILQGKRLYLNSNVMPMKSGTSSFNYNVKDGTKKETTTLFIINKKLFKVFCTCGKCTGKHYCPHVYASLLKYDDKPSDEKDNMVKQRNATTEKKKSANEKKLNPLAVKIQMMVRGEHDYTLDEAEEIISSYIHEGFDFGEDFSKIRKVYLFDWILNVLRKNEEIANHVFAKCDLSLVPQSININSVCEYLLLHPMKVTLLSERSIHGLYSNSKIVPINKSHLLSLGMSMNHAMHLSSFMNDCDQMPDFFQDITILNYMKKNIPAEKYVSFFKRRIESNRLTAQEFFFLYPYMDEKTKQSYINKMPGGTITESGYYYPYTPDESTEPNSFVKCRVSKNLYGLINSRNVLSENKLISYYYAIPFIKKEELSSIVGRFRLLSAAKSKKSNTNDIILYCILAFALAFYKERPDLVQFVENIEENIDKEYHQEAVWTIFFECQKNMNLKKKEKYHVYEIKEEK